MPVVVLAGTGEGIGRPRVGYANLFTTSGHTIVATADIDGFPKEYAYDGLPFRRWKTGTGDNWIRVDCGTAKAASFFGIYGHNLAAAGESIKLQHSTDGNSWTDVEEVTPSDTSPIFKTFTEVSRRYWRFLMEGVVTNVTLGDIMLGTYVEFERGPIPGFSSPLMADDDDLSEVMSEGGLPLGSYRLRKSKLIELQLDDITDSWYRSTLQPLIDHLNGGGRMYLQWAPLLYPNEIAYCWASRAQPRPQYSQTMFVSSTLSLRGAME